MRKVNIGNDQAKWRNTLTEGIDYPHLCDKCGKFLTRKQMNIYLDFDWVVKDGARYEWLCEKCEK